MSKILRCAIPQLAASIFCALCLNAQTSPAPPSTAAADTRVFPQEVLTIKKQVNLVVIPVVVRDKQGKQVGSLTRDDFRILDDGKPQTISTFNLETNSPTKQTSVQSSPGATSTGPGAPAVPLHYFAYLFDDVHLNAGDLMQVSAAAEKHLASAIGPRDRAAVFTTSGDVTTQFTADSAELSSAIRKVKPGFSASDTHCPYMNDYLAQRIIHESGNGQDLGSGSTPVWDAATLDAWACLFQKGQHMEQAARQAALNAARDQEDMSRASTRRSLLAVQLAVRRLAAMPGSRTLILVSPGFLTGDDHSEQEIAIDLASKQKIIVNALDARGLTTDRAGADSAARSSDPQAALVEGPYIRQAIVAQNGVLAELAYGTGGEFIRDSNDLSGGFDQLAAVPDYIYELGFSPADLKHPGRYHTLKVQLVGKHGWSVQARSGYTEMAGADAPEKQIPAELEQALFSRDLVQSFPITLQMGFAKKDETHREFFVTTHIDLSTIHLHKGDSSNTDNVTLVCGLFDVNGNYLQGRKRELSLRLSDQVLKQITSGMNVSTSFDVVPGAYMIRVVVRDSGSGLLSTANGSGFIQ